MKNIVTIISLILLLASCNKPIALDDPNVEGTGPGALAVIEKAEAALAGITSISAEIEATKDSDMYGFEKTYEGTLKAEFSGEPGGLGNRWFETKQSAKGRDKHIRGVVTKEGLKELHLLKKKVIKGDENASSAAWIATAFYSVYGDETFFTGLKDYTKRHFYKQHPQKQNVFLETIETVHGKECYVIQAYNPDYDQLKFRYYFGVKDGLYYGNSTEVDGEDGNQISKTFIKELILNEALPEFDVKVPEDFAVEMWVAPWDQKSMEVGMQAHDWTLENANGGKQTLSKEYAENVVLLDFWATWCGPCKAKMPFIQKMHETYKDQGLKVISVLSGDVGHEKEAAAYVKKYKYTFDLVFGNNELSEKYKIRFLPTVMMVDHTGKIIHFRDTPGVNDNIDEKVELEDAIKKALKL
ncbi:TlpA disulfide reductase family protein [Seonamhaeicola sp.]|uniref:TlpA disulfide reductase family protein n=1 Tax=Seonamhaeicola sp. TaxID=1912245 RepID=UPI0026169E65|nr:TlpA disulfide reductase family protein [Seonamhaeicola sp.]